MAATNVRTIIGRRCDKPMRRSKERAGKDMKWKCGRECRNCICCIEKDEAGNESHVNLISDARKRDEL